MERKLATVQCIEKLLPIPGADKIETAVILGWTVVVKKGEFMAGDLVYFLEIDSWVPNGVAPFLTSEGKEPREYKGVQGERLRTVKLRKQLSQGLVLPIPDNLTGMYSEGQDVTDILGILKWEAEDRHSGTRLAQDAVTRAFPFFLRKTDQERIQNYGKLVECCLDEFFEVTVKKDGSSCTVFRADPSSPYYGDAKKITTKKLTFMQKVFAFFKKGGKEPVYGICSRNLLLPLHGDSNFHIAASKVLLALSKMDGESVAIQGEVVAPNIQDNYEKVTGVEFHAFDAFDIDNQEYYLPAGRRNLCGAYNIPHVTVIAEDRLKDIVNYSGDVVKDCLAYAEGDGDNPGVRREGVVFKSAARRFSFKCVSNEYLLKTGK